MGKCWVKAKESTGRKLQDAQGKVIPTLGRRDVEVHLKSMWKMFEDEAYARKSESPYQLALEAGWSLDATAGHVPSTTWHWDSNGHATSKPYLERTYRDDRGGALRG